MHRVRLLAIALAGSLSLSAAIAQQPRSGPEIPAHTRQPLALDSGYLDNAGPSAVVVHREVLSFPTTTWSTSARLASGARRCPKAPASGRRR